MRFKCRLKVIFAKQEIKQGTFAKKIGLSESALSSLVTNRTLPSFTNAYVIAKALNMHVEDIWIEEDKK
ncbi:helix-turn-helix transcriptional regulator [Bacillus cereus]|uniref:Transcriptional regulator n=1 Tax=Bacillus cereus TaxID=1396 RepID=A0A2A8ZPX2_BACCE|nr:helix-turn-helix transcriptional regulator [Bacillus cereus]PFE06700.1 transcriptional regulator [Bacillus cereus]